MSLGYPCCGSLETAKHKPDCKRVIVGHLYWIRTMKGYTAVKHEAAIRTQAQPETKKRWKEETIGTPVPLCKMDWLLSLSELMLIHPMTDAQLKEYKAGWMEES